MNLETNTSLSFLWSCRGTDMRPLSAESPSLTNGSQDKATSWVHVNTTLGAPLAITYFQPKEIGKVRIYGSLGYGTQRSYKGVHVQQLFYNTRKRIEGKSRKIREQ